MSNFLAIGYRAVHNYAAQNIFTTPQRIVAGRALAGACTVGAAAFSAFYLGNPIMPSSYRDQVALTCGRDLLKADILPNFLQPYNITAVLACMPETGSCLYAAGAWFGRVALGGITMIAVPSFFFRHAVDVKALFRDPKDEETLELVERLQALFSEGKDVDCPEAQEILGRLKVIAPDLLKKPKTE
jgi:hypothetical protein